MNIPDVVLPHRLLINCSLRKASASLRAHINHSQAEYEAAISRCKAEIDVLAAKNDAQYAEKKDEFMKLLAVDQRFYQAVQTDVAAYVDLFFQKRLTFDLLKLHEAKLDVAKEHCQFLSAQMELIGQEIEQLKQRKDTLASQASVKDILALLALNGSIDAGDSDDAKSLLQKVDALLQSDVDQVKGFALKKLRIILQKRADYAQEIQYIDWVIRQKKQISRECASARAHVASQRNQYEQDRQKVKAALHQLTAQLDKQGEKTRRNWEQPMERLTMKIAALENEVCLPEYRSVKNRLAILYRNKEYKQQEEDYRRREQEVASKKSEVQTSYQRKLQQAEREIRAKQRAAEAASSRLSSAKSADHRFFLAKLFTSTDGVSEAKKNLKQAKTDLRESESARLSLHTDMAQEITALDEELSLASPTKYSPTDEEYEEIRELMTRKKALEREHDYAQTKKQLDKLYDDRCAWEQGRHILYGICKQYHVSGLFKKKEG